MFATAGVISRAFFVLGQVLGIFPEEGVGLGGRMERERLYQLPCARRRLRPWVEQKPLVLRSGTLGMRRLSGREGGSSRAEPSPCRGEAMQKRRAGSRGAP